MEIIPSLNSQGECTVFGSYIQAEIMLWKALISNVVAKCSDILVTKLISEDLFSFSPWIVSVTCNWPCWELS